MRINPICFNTNFCQPSFGVNLQSPKLKFNQDDFYVRIKGYGKNYHWVEKIKETADDAVDFIRENMDFESILRYITNGVFQANQFPADVEKRLHTGILRTERKNWRYGSDWKSGSIITHYDGAGSKYETYKNRFDYTVSHPLKNPYYKFMLTRPVRNRDYGRFLEHSEPHYINSSLDMVGSLYRMLHERYIKKEATEADLNDINAIIAEIRWILAHATPWERGSDAISNTFIRSVYKAMGIKTTPLKKGISLDLEAYCTNLEDYKKNFSDYFVKKPVIVD